MVQVPIATSVSVVPFVPDVVQVPVVSEENVTALPEVPPLAESVNGPLPMTRSGSGAKLIACVALAMVMLKACVASGSTLFDAVTTPVKVPAAVGVPESTLAASESPEGMAPDVTEKLGAGEPVAV